MDRAWIICIWWRGQKATYFPRTHSFQLKHNICFVVCSTLRYHFSSFINRVFAMSSLIRVGISSFSYAATSLKYVHEKYFWRRIENRCLNLLLTNRRRNGCNCLKHDYHYGMTRDDFINRFSKHQHWWKKPRSLFRCRIS